MPQMKPILWLNLMIMFSFMMIIFIINNFFNMKFCMINNNSINNKKLFKKFNNWMW